MPKYRVTHGDVVQGGKSFSKDAVLEMSVADAAELGAAVELAKEAAPEAKAEKPEPKHETKPVTHSHEVRPEVAAPKKPHAGKDKTK